MRKATFLSMVALLSSAFLCFSCDIDDLSKSLTDGAEENYVIANKNKGTLNVRETHKAEAAFFDVEENPYGVENLEFCADGTYHITFNLDNSYMVQAPAQQQLTVDVDGTKMQVPMRALTRSNYGNLRSTGTYTYSDGEYVLMGDYNWKMQNGRLVITEDGETYSYKATRVPDSEAAQDALTQRLCHTWILNRVLLKLYNMDTNKLVFTYHLTEDQVRENCIDTFVFSASKKFYRYKEGVNNGNGRWEWKVKSEQTLHYAFEYLSFDNPVRVYGENDLTVYFADNRLYLTEACEALNEVEGNDKNIRLKALLLYQLDVKGN